MLTRYLVCVMPVLTARTASSTVLTTLPGVRDDSVHCAHRFLKLCLLRYLVCVMTVLTACTASSTVLTTLPGVRDDGVDCAHRLLKLC